MNCSNFRQYWECAGQNLCNTIQINGGFTVIQRFRTVLSPPFPAALCHGILGAFCSHSLAHSSISTAEDRRALHTVLLSETISPNSCLLIFDLLSSHTTLFLCLVLMIWGLHLLALYSIRSCCNPESCSFSAQMFMTHIFSYTSYQIYGYSWPRPLCWVQPRYKGLLCSSLEQPPVWRRLGGVMSPQPRARGQSIPCLSQHFGQLANTNSSAAQLPGKHK